MKRQGLQKLVCVECDARCYMTLSTVRAGLPACACGGGFTPEDLELAMEILPADRLEANPAYREYVRQASSVMHGQASHVQRGRKVRQPEQVAFERLEAERRASARARRLSGLVQFKAAATAAADIPF
jgi:hypothetical protein